MSDNAAEDIWPKLTRVSGKTCIDCHQLLTCADYRAHGIRCSNCVVTTRALRTCDALLAGLGFLACRSFFIAAAFVLYAFWDKADWSAFDTKLGSLSLSELTGTVCKFVLLLFATSALIGWAFLKPGKKSYRLGVSSRASSLAWCFSFASNITADGIAPRIGRETTESCGHDPDKESGLPLS
jgi:hypothetical protein